MDDIHYRFGVIFRNTVEITWQIVETNCIDILEDRLGIRKVVNNNNTLSDNSRLDGYTQPKKNRLGFLTDLFRSKKSKENAPHKPSIAYELGPTCDSRRYSEVDIKFLHGQKYSDPNHKLAPLRSSIDDESTVLDSIKKLHISRNDNPAIGADPPEPEASDIDSILKQRTPRTSQTDDSRSSPDHSFLIRSPPPMYRRDRSLSPPAGNSPLSLRTEANRAQLEEDAAQILGLHPNNRTKNKGNSTQRSVSPRQLQPIISPRGSMSTADQAGEDRRDSFGSDADALPDIRPGPSQLGPLRGPVPKISGPSVNKRLHLLRQERSGVNRSPTPPSWDYGKQDGLPSGMLPIGGDTADDCECAPSIPQQRKKKKKKSKLLTARGDDETETMNGNVINYRNDDDLQLGELQGQGNKKSLEQLTPRLNAKRSTAPKNSDKTDQRNFNRDIQTLLH